MDPAELAACAAAYDRRRKADDDARAARADTARAALPRLAALCREAGAHRVALFGSLATGRLRRKRLDDLGPDINLWVEGLRAEDYLDLLADLLREAPCDVDLVRAESAPPSLSARVAAEGREL